MFKWFNWEHGNFEVSIRALEGRANFYLNYVGETSYEENALSGIPINRNDSIWYAELDSADAELRTAEVAIYRSDFDRSPRFCYNCWYYVTAVVSDPNAVTYRVVFERIQDLGTDFLQLELGKAESFSIPLMLTQRYAKFMLESKDSFDLKVQVSSG